MTAVSWVISEVGLNLSVDSTTCAVAESARNKLILGDMQVPGPLNCMTWQILTHTYCCLKNRILPLWAHLTLGQEEAAGQALVAGTTNNHDMEEQVPS